MRNSFEFGGVLLASWILVLGGRLLIPRVLTRQQFGLVSFLESMATLGIGSVSLGFDTYVRNVVTADPSRASQIMLPVRRLQTSLGSFVIAALAVAFWFASRDASRVVVVVLFACAQLSMTVGQTSNAYLHALHRVRETTVSTIAVKLTWLGLLLALAFTGRSLLALPVAAAASEMARAIWLDRRARQRFLPDPSASIRLAFPVVRASVPYYLNSLNIAVNGLALPILIGLLSGEGDLALFAGASMVMTMPQIFLPLIGPVLLPALVSERAKGDETVWNRVRDLLTLLLPLLTVIAGTIAVFAPVVIQLAIGSRYERAASALAFMALGLPATFCSVVLSTALIVVGRSWQTTLINWITMLGLVAAGAALMLVVGRNNPGAPATGAALVLIVFEWITVAWMCAVAPVAVITRRCAGHVLLSVSAWAIAEGGRWSGNVGGPSKILAACLLVTVAARDLPRFVSTVRSVLHRPTG